MPAPIDEAKRSIMSRLLEENGLSGTSRLYREAERASLTATGTDGVFRLDANAHAAFAFFSAVAIVVVRAAVYTFQSEAEHAC